MIELDRVCLSFDERPILKDVSLSVPPGGKVLIQGPSGSGKSTLLKVLIGLYAPQSGRVLFDGAAVFGRDLRRVRSETAFISQEPVVSGESAREALLLPFTFRAHRHRPPSDTEIDAVLKRLLLPPEILDQPCRILSGGEKQRIAIARALLIRKRIFCADEVTSALDPAAKAAVIGALLKDPELTVLSVSHDPEWASHCSRIWHLESGRLEERR